MYYRARYYNSKGSRFLSQDPLHSPLEKWKSCRAANAPSVYDLLEIDDTLAPLLRFRSINAVMAAGLSPTKAHPYAYAENSPLLKLDPLGLYAGPQTPGCDVVGPGAQFLSCSFDCCDAHDDCYTNSTSFCTQASWTRPNSDPQCWACNVAVAKCFARNASNIGSRKPCNLSDF
jgi:hypothetical protein